MRLSWNKIRVRAKSFADDWSDAAYEKGETQSFYNDLFYVFGKSRRSVATYEEAVKKLDNRQGFIDLFALHETLTAHLFAAAKPKPRHARAKK